MFKVSAVLRELLVGTRRVPQRTIFPVTFVLVGIVVREAHVSLRADRVFCLQMLSKNGVQGCQQAAGRWPEACL